MGCCGIIGLVGLLHVNLSVLGEFDLLLISLATLWVFLTWGSLCGCLIWCFVNVLLEVCLL